LPDELGLVDAHDVSCLGQDSISQLGMFRARFAAAAALPTSPSFPPRMTRVGALII
jgi:hypothetical protein